MPYRLFIIGWILSICLGCQPKQIPVAISVAKGINRDQTAQPAPLYIKFYQVSDPTQLQAADILELWQDEQAALGQSVLSVTPVTVFPGQAAQHILRLQSTMSAICVVGFYRQPWNKHWRDCWGKPALSRYFGSRISVEVKAQGIYIHDR